ncbi:MAG: zf-HC2 domain-containing protein [Planctomycetes bacterium]|nr:zf-HC2 domain-containing protein [Planctomycetota bacterium]
MWPHKREDGEEIASPCQTWLTAYVDGELRDEERARVEAWLAGNPEARAEVEAQQHLKALWERCPVPGPDALAWDDVLARVESALDAAATEDALTRFGPPRTPPRSRWRWAAWAAVAAAILLTVWLGQRVAPPDDGSDSESFELVSDTDVVIDDMDPADARALVVGRVPSPGSFGLEPGERLEVVSPEEVTIISMDGSDTPALVVGEPPVAGPLVLARRDEVQVDHMAPHPADETMPYLHAPEGGWPMVVAPLKAARKDGP